MDLFGDLPEPTGNQCKKNLALEFYYLVILMPFTAAPSLFDDLPPETKADDNAALGKREGNGVDTVSDPPAKRARLQSECYC